MSIIANALRPILMANPPKDEGDFASYIRALDSGRFKDRLCFGISDKKRGFYSLDPVQQPGSLFCGGMGSGKSVSMRFTAATHMFTNSENTLYLFMDPLKGMTDYRMLFDNSVVDTSSGVACGFENSAKIVPLIELVYDETMARKEVFTAMGATNIYDYDKKMKNKPDFKPIARIVIFIEEFHAIPNSEQVKFSMYVDKNGSIASKMKELMRVGRSYGIFFNFATQRATYDDLPSALKPGISTNLCFKMNTPGDAAAMNLSHATEISVEQRGRCAYEDGFIQFPYLDDAPLAELLKKYYKPFNAKLLKYTPADFRIALSENGTAGLVKVKPLAEVVRNFQSYDFQDIVTRILESFRFEVSEQKQKTYIAELIATKNGDKFAVKVAKDRKDLDAKKMDSLKKSMPALGVKGVFIFTGEAAGGGMGGGMGASKDESVKTIDYEDMTQIGNIFDNQKKLEDDGTYRELYLRYFLAAESDFEVKDEAIEAESEVVAEKVEAPKEEKKIIKIETAAEREEKKKKALAEMAKAELTLDEDEDDIEEYDFEYLSERRLLEEVEFVHKILFDKKVKVKNITEEKRIELIAKYQLTDQTQFINYFYMINKGIHKNKEELVKIFNNKVVITNIDADQLAQLKQVAFGEVVQEVKPVPVIVEKKEVPAQKMSQAETKKKNNELIEELTAKFEQQVEAITPEEVVVEKRGAAQLEEIEKINKTPIKPVVNTQSLAKLKERVKKDIASNS